MCLYFISKDGIITNIANYILIFFILFFIISGILFYKCGYNNLEDDIKEILELKEEENRKEKNRLETTDIKCKEEKNNKIINKKKKKLKTKKKKKD
jgi:hypothetical protein